MLDIQFIRQNPQLVEEKAKQKGYSIDVQELLSTDDKRRVLLTQIEDLRQKRNQNADKMKQAGKPDMALVEQGKQIKQQLAELEKQYTPTEERFNKLLESVPNMPLSGVPIGASEDENVVERKVGEPLKYDFEPKHHWEILNAKDYMDKERAAKISGSRFAYLKGDLVKLQFAIVQFVLDVLTNEQILAKIIKDNNLDVSPRPFIPILPPAMLRTEPYQASARLNAEEVTYKLADDDLWLNASAEHTLCNMYWNEIVSEPELPLRYIGYSTSFRREAGTYGKDTEGLIRMHQFDKLEMESFSTPEQGIGEHKLFVAIQEYLVQQIGLPYQLLRKCTFDIGKPNATGVDIECWFPAQGKYRETHTADYMTDYQARRLKTRVRRTKGEQIDFVHTNDATAIALGRTMAAIVENFQTKDGQIVIPEVLRPFMGNRSQI
jgi:seryl-tRNA synthetase